MNEDEIEVVYTVHTDASALEARIDALLLEQTVELPRSALHKTHVRDHMVGRVIASGPDESDGFRVTLAQPLAAVGGDPAQLLNVLFGNCSLQPDVELVDVRLPPTLTRILRGPSFGSKGVRALCGAQGRALTASVLKPMGLSVGETADLCGTLASSGLDFVKDDHGLADHPFNRFEERVRACLAATGKAAQATGKRTIYVPNLIGSPATVLQQASQAIELGVQAIMVSPMLLGLPFLNELTRNLGLPVLAHPSFGGATRIAPQALLGKLFPIFGADAVIYPNVGGRFSYGRDVCAAIAKALRTPCNALRSALPVPAGGIRMENINSVLEFYGEDTMLLLGGTLLDSADSGEILSRSRQFVDAVQSFRFSL